VYKKIEVLDTIWLDAKKACKDGIVYNLVLAYEFKVSLTDSPFVTVHEERAREWQSEVAPSHLPFSHGQYFKGETGMQHVSNELKAKVASRRALLSLISMTDILGSGDAAIPSFMVAQFGKMRQTLYVTEYFRALEVGKFLPINLAEMALMIRKVIIGLERPETVRLVLLAFQAHLTPGFHCLERAPLDIATGVEIGATTAGHDLKKLLYWLEGKGGWPGARYESEILTSGLEGMVEGVKLCASRYPPQFLSALNLAVQSLRRVKELRISCSEERIIDGEYRKYVRHLEVAMNELRRALDGAA
jgi:hypothetical protein